MGAVGGLTLGKQNQGVPLREGASGGKLCSGDGHFLDKGEGGSLVILVHIFVVEAEPVAVWAASWVWVHSGPGVKEYSGGAGPSPRASR